jgi:hypothetical protein
MCIYDRYERMRRGTRLTRAPTTIPRARGRSSDGVRRVLCASRDSVSHRRIPDTTARARARPLVEGITCVRAPHGALARTPWCPRAHLTSRRPTARPHPRLTARPHPPLPPLRLGRAEGGHAAPGKLLARPRGPCGGVERVAAVGPHVLVARGIVRGAGGALALAKVRDHLACGGRRRAARALKGAVEPSRAEHGLNW